MAKKWFDSKKIRVLKCPGNFPDMNPIENLWDILTNKICPKAITTKRQVIKLLFNVWFHSEKISGFCKKFIEYMPESIKD